MHELGILSSEFIERMRASRRAGGPLRGEAKSLARRHGLKVIGSGDDSIVVLHPSEEDKVIALHRTVNMAFHNNLSSELLFNYTNLLATLFPHNFPKIYESVGNDGDWTNITGTVRERIQRRRLVNVFNNNHPFSEVQRRGIEAGLPGFHDFDTNRKNFIVSIRGGEYYIEPVYLFVDQVPRVETAVKHLVEDGNYSYEEQERIAGYVQKLQELVVEERV